MPREPKPDHSRDLIFFRPAGQCVEVVVVSGGEITVTQWSRDIAFGKAFELMKILLEIK